MFSLIVAALAAATLQASAWTIDTGVIQSGDGYHGDTVANGTIGILSSVQPFGAQQVLLNGAYDAIEPGGIPTILKTFDPLHLSFSIDGTPIVKFEQITNFRQQLDMQHAALTTSFDYSDAASISYTTRALRDLPFTALSVVTVTAKRSIEIDPDLASAAAPDLVDVKVGTTSVGAPRAPQGNLSMLVSSARSFGGRLTVTGASAFVFDEAPAFMPTVAPVNASSESPELGFSKRLSAGQSYSFAVVGTTISSAHADDPTNQAQRLTIFAALDGTNALIEAHERAWADLWRTDIRIEGDDTTQRDVRGMLYHLYSFGHADTGYAIPPMGLSRAGYSGHIFWDSELWMYPAMLALQPPIARSMLQYRFDRLSGAERNAAAHGYRGAMFPWESGASGEEDTPVWALTGPFEQHITADVGIAAWNYYCVTHDKYWLQSEGYPLLKETADFWTSRVTRNGPGRYDIVNVVAADEFAQNVDDNAFTNAAAREDLEDASAAARVLGTAPDPDWANVAKNIPILKFPDGTVREYAGYNGQQTKQADVELLGYPLHAISDSSTIRRDLDYYGARIANGPAMTQSIYAILQERLGMPETAFATFEKGYRSHEVAPFDTISEVAGDTNVYFATGAGGFLQTMLYGFGGLEITPQGIVQRPTRLPAEWRSLTLTGIGPHLKTYVIRSSDQKPKAAAH